MSKTVKLQFCPFCGNTDLEVVTCSDWTTHYVSCSDCGTEGPSGKTESEAIEKWDKRVLAPKGARKPKN